MKKIFIIMFLLIVLNSVEAIGADWKFFGNTKDNLVEYYDAESVEYLPAEGARGIDQYPYTEVRVWTKIVKGSEVARIKKVHKKEIIEKSAEKVRNGYVPPYTSVHPGTSFDDNIIISWEEVATYSGLKTNATSFCKISCTEKKIRILTYIHFDNNGTPDEDYKGDWEYISPESMGEALEKILCIGRGKIK